MSNRIAVFNSGRVEQVGTPREIYDHPATSFVAGFVGTSNVLSAERSQQLLGVAEPHSIRPERLHVRATLQQGVASSRSAHHATSTTIPATAFVAGFVGDVQRAQLPNARSSCSASP